MSSCSLKSKIDGIKVDVEWGFSESVEGLNDEFSLTAFLLTFTDKAALEKLYVPHPAHKAFVEILKPHLDKVFVFRLHAEELRKVKN